MDTLLRELRHALRGLSRSPALTCAAITCFALGIGANIVMFSIVDALFLRAPAHVQDPAAVVRLYVAGDYPWGGHYVESGRSYPEYTSVASRVTGFSDAAAYWVMSLSVGRGVDAEAAEVGLATHTFFGLLGVHPALGRWFAAEDDHIGAAPVVVLSDGFWTRRFGRDSSVIGHTIEIGGLTSNIVGVAPYGFSGIDLTGPDVWLPMAAVAPSVFAPDALTNPGDMWLSIIGRLRKGAASTAAAAEASTALTAARPPDDARSSPIRVLLGPIQEARGPAWSQANRVALWVGGMSVIVLLIACANVSNLLLAQSAGRRREMGIRLTLGARPGRIVRLLVVDGLVLAVLGCAGALLIILWGGSAVRGYFLPNGLGGDGLDLHQLGYMAGVAIACGLASSLLPAWRATRPSLAAALTAGPRESGIRRSSSPRVLLATQTALSLTLLVGAGVFVQSLRHLEAVDLGLEPRHLLSVTIDFRGTRLGQEGGEDLYRRTAESVAQVVGLQSVSLAQGSPFGDGFGGSLTLRGRPTPREFPGGGPYQYAVTPEYFTTVGMPILRGRGFTAADRAGAAKVVVVNQALSRALWPDDSAIGQCVFVNSQHDCATVVGLVKDAPRWSVLQLHDAEFYVPLAQLPADRTPTAMLVRTTGRPEGVIPAIRHAILTVAPGLPFVEMRPLEAAIAPQLEPWRLGTTMFTAYGVLGLLLTALGLYGVLANMVNRRSQEIGVRMALGAEGRQVRLMVLKDGLFVTAIGVVIGVVLVLATGHLIATLLYDESPRDALVMLAAGSALLLAGGCASWWPALRATQVDPMVALRAE